MANNLFKRMLTAFFSGLVVACSLATFSRPAPSCDLLVFEAPLAKTWTMGP